MKRNIIIRTFFGTIPLVTLLVTAGCQGVLSDKNNGDSNRLQWTFENEQLGSLPGNWKIAETATKGKTAIWEIVTNDSSPSNSKAVAVTKSKNRKHTFNLLIASETEFKDLEVEVEVKPVGGNEDEGGGPMWRVQDADNYYVARWNPLEDNFRVYTVKDGHRKQLSSAKFTMDDDAWHKIKIVHKGKKIIASFDGKALIEIEDDTFKDAGMVGLWTKADATTAFDNLTIERLPK